MLIIVLVLSQIYKILASEKFWQKNAGSKLSTDPGWCSLLPILHLLTLTVVLLLWGPYIIFAKEGAHLMDILQSYFDLGDNVRYLHYKEVLKTRKL